MLDNLNIKPAVDEILRREKAANRRPEGADHAEIIETVAQEYELDTDVLSKAFIDETVMAPN